VRCRGHNSLPGAGMVESRLVESTSRNYVVHTG